MTASFIWLIIGLRHIQKSRSFAHGCCEAVNIPASEICKTVPSACKNGGYLSPGYTASHPSEDISSVIVSSPTFSGIQIVFILFGMICMFSPISREGGVISMFMPLL